MGGLVVVEGVGVGRGGVKVGQSVKGGVEGGGGGGGGQEGGC